MTVLLTELREKLIQQCDAEEVLELLDISTEELVRAFPERLEERFDYIVKELGLEEEEDEDEEEAE